jgi:hypothetical protein
MSETCWRATFEAQLAQPGVYQNGEGFSTAANAVYLREIIAICCQWAMKCGICALR